MSEDSAAVHAAFVDAYEPYVTSILQARSLSEPPGWADALAQGRSWLDRTLQTLLELPAAEQRRSPLEVFQEALGFPTRVLAAAGLEPVERDPVAVRALPGDLYELAPASSQDLGEAAWKAHVAWGIAKAKAVGGVVPVPSNPERPSTKPVVALLGTDLMDRSRIEPVAQSGGLRLEVWRNPAAIEAGLEGSVPAILLVDLAHPAADEAIRAGSEAGVRTIGFGPHVDDVALVRARSLGATDALARSIFFRRLPELLPRQV